MKKKGIYYGEVYKYTLKATEKSIANGDAGKCYIGQTYNSKERQGDWDSTDPRYAGPKINRAREIYPPEDWDREVLFSGFYMKESTRKKKIDAMETAMIRKYDSINNGFNISEGRGMKGLHHTEEARRKMSQMKMGHIVSDETKERISKGVRKHWRKVKRAMQKAAAKLSKSPVKGQDFEHFCQDCRQLYTRFGLLDGVLPPGPHLDNTPILFNTMQSNIMYLPSGAVYNNRKEAKLMMGHARFNKALKDGLMLFIKDSGR